ncbi:hypothetical protein LLG96_03925 [bacterium]|nr:hypothetical protein [bacterium]
MTEPFSTSDLPLSVGCYYALKDTIGEDAVILERLSRAIDTPVSLSLSQYFHWYAMVFAFKPDLIIELGRGPGNSTSVFCQASRRLKNTIVKSFCFGPGWDKKKNIVPLVDADWFSRLEIYSGDLTRVDFSPHIQPFQRVMVLWDAHGYEVANHVLGHIMPLLQQKQHIVICHDFSDNRVVSCPRSYGGKSFWMGMNDFDINSDKRERLNLFWINTVVDQAIPLVDFCWRNSIELHSADFELYEIKRDHPEIIREIQSFIPGHVFSEINHWVYFSLNESNGDYHFPALLKKRFSLLNSIRNNYLCYTVIKNILKVFR